MQILTSVLKTLSRFTDLGETLFDWIVAKAAGIPFLPVCTGKYDRSAFKDSDAVAVIETLAEGYEAIRTSMRVRRIQKNFFVLSLGNEGLLSMS